MDWSREPMQVLVKRFNRRGTITEYDLLSALDRNPTTINAGADICAEAKSTILAQANRIADLEAEAERMAQEAVAEATKLTVPVAAMDQHIKEAVAAAIRGLRGYLGNLTYDAARIDDYLAELTGGKDE